MNRLGAVTPEITPVRPGDLSPMARIHAASFDDPWSVDMLSRILAMPGAFGLAAREKQPDGTATPFVYGFALCRIAVDECELLSLAVEEAARGHGIGGLLVDQSLVHAAARGARCLFLEVAENNVDAQALYRSRMFRPIGRRKDYYQLAGGGRLDAITMACDLPAMEDATRLHAAGG